MYMQAEIQLANRVYNMIPFKLDITLMQATNNSVYFTPASRQSFHEVSRNLGKDWMTITEGTKSLGYWKIFSFFLRPIACLF